MVTRRISATLRARVAGLPLHARATLAGALAFGVLGGVCGLVLGLVAYPPTAWFAVLEVGAPAALAGALIGLVAGGLVRSHPKA